MTLFVMFQYDGLIYVVSHISAAKFSINYLLFSFPFCVVNVLEHDLIRNEIKNYSDWPTIPQLYVKGEFVGGCDIMTALFNDGSMEELMKEKKLID